MLKISKLGDVCKIQSGNSIPAKEKDDLYRNVNEGLPYVATKDIGIDGSINFENGVTIPSKFNSKFRLSEKDSVLICAEGGSAGKKIAYSNKDCYFVNKLLSIKPKNEIDAKYIYYYTLGNEFQYQFRKSIHGLIGGVSLSKIKSFQITYPPLAEQQRIVAKLATTIAEINKSIEATKLSIKNLNKYIGKVTDFLIHNNLENYKNFTLDDITDTITCGVAKRPEYEDKGIIFLSARNVKNGKMKWVNYKFISEQAHKILTKNSKPEIGDILYSRVGAGFGDAAIIDKDIELSIFVSLTLIKVKPIVLNEYLYYYLNSPIIKELARKNITGTSVGNLNVGAVKLFKIKLPNLNNQKLIIDKLKLLKTHGESIINIYNKKMNNYILLKNSIISSLLSYKKAKVA